MNCEFLDTPVFVTVYASAKVNDNNNNRVESSYKTGKVTLVFSVMFPNFSGEPASRDHT